jgi:hypothetical protein
MTLQAQLLPFQTVQDCLSEEVAAPLYQQTEKHKNICATPNCIAKKEPNEKS